MKNKRILIVEDYYSNAEMLADVLKMDDFEVAIITEGKHFLNEVRKFRPDLVVMDIALGDLDGRDLCNELLSMPDFSGIPVILISATLEASFYDIPCQATAFVTKPFNIDKLSAQIKTLLRQQ